MEHNYHKSNNAITFPLGKATTFIEEQNRSRSYSYFCGMCEYKI